MSTHDENGPSALLKRALCPGSAHAERGLPNEETPDATQGTRRHAIVARLARISQMEGIAARDAALLGIDPADQAPVARCLAIIDANRALIQDGDESIELVEYQVDLSFLGIPKGGTLDWVLLIPKRGLAVFADWKFGSQPTDHPRYNWQLKAYAVGLCTAFGVSAINAIIGQPELDEDQQERVTTWQTEDLARFSKEIQAVVAATKPLDAPRHPSDRACQWCRARPSCAARATIAAQTQVISDPAASLLALPEAERTRQYERLQLAIDVMQKALDQVEAKVLEGALTIPGYAIGEGRKGNREWRDEEAAKLFLQTRLPDPGMAVVEKVISPAAAEKVLGKKSEAARQMADFIHQNPGKSAVVRAQRVIA